MTPSKIYKNEPTWLKRHKSLTWINYSKTKNFYIDVKNYVINGENNENEVILTSNIINI
jgi:hypothetical protein